jgi:hypothetical protein
MLHNCWYPQGLEAFTSLASTNPDCAMAYWGIAVSARANPLVGPPDAAALERGLQAVAKAKAAGAPTPREHDYIAAIEAYYYDWQQLEYPARVLAYEAAMEQLEIEQLQSLQRTLKRSRDVYWAEQVEIQRLAAEAWTGYVAGKKSEALKQMEAAADLEDANEKHVAMENRLWPMREPLGELLLELNRPTQGEASISRTRVFLMLHVRSREEWGSE